MLSGGMEGIGEKERERNESDIRDNIALERDLERQASLTLISLAVSVISPYEAWPHFLSLVPPDPSVSSQFSFLLKPA